ncbi:hypothetical protein JTB14_017018 [Gonioctena quinquepunctata]|nr:hypothetical protein JTB14_017018 [Gonioctena quinquepunctata]
MHTDLSPHLHTQQCNELIKLLQDCHRDHAFRKFFGICNSIDRQMTKCIRGERVAKRARNLEKSRETKNKVSQLLRQDREDP